MNKLKLNNLRLVPAVFFLKEAAAEHQYTREGTQPGDDSTAR